MPFNCHGSIAEAVGREYGAIPQHMHRTPASKWAGPLRCPYLAQGTYGT